MRTSLPLAMIALAGLCAHQPSAAADRYFIGGAGGISTLSADGSTIVQPPRLESSSYKPENGPTASAFTGVHLNDYLSVQAGYFWNRNDLRLSSLAGASYFDQNRSSSQRSLLPELMLYFRNRASWVRPYLSAGPGIVVGMGAPAFSRPNCGDPDIDPFSQSYHDAGTPRPPANQSTGAGSR